MFMEFQLGTKKSLDGIVDYFIKFGLCLKISQTSFMDSTLIPTGMGVADPKLVKGY